MAFLEEMLVVAQRGDINKYRITHALISCSQDKGYKNVSVGDICRACELSRQTFYRYFTSKHDIAPWFWDKLAERYVMRVGTEYTWYESFLENFRAADPYFSFFDDAAASSSFGSPDSLISHTVSYRKSVLTDILTNEAGAEITPELAFELDFFCSAESQIPFTIMEKNDLATPEQKAEAVVACIPQNLRRLIDEHVIAKRRSGSLGTAAETAQGNGPAS